MIEEIIRKNHFTLVRQRKIDEVQGTLWEIEHEKSGAKLAWMERNDENMTFAIAFRTIPTDSTGVFHILEHSVLAGSDKYPVKEPFVELLKSSLQTFLNAMTYPDKTVYPISSRNKQDFHNLMEVYMDAVLHPTAVKCSNVFRQEGWRLEFDENGEPMFQGVVYNEMKGAYSNAARIAYSAMTTGLYPDTCYAVESGGDPAHIPELTYEHFVSEHKKYYHPSNALILLDGSVDLQDSLSLLDSVLSAYDRQVMDFPIPIQKSLPYREERIPYEVAPGENSDNQVIVSFGKLLCRFDDPVELHAANILADYLAGDSDAPLKRAILDAGLGEDMALELGDGMQQAWFGWQVWNTREENIPEIKQAIRSAVEDVLRDGLDQDRLAGCYNYLAFKLLDWSSPRGLTETLTMVDPWLYGGDPAQNLHYRDQLKDLKEKLDNGYLESMMRRLLLDESEGYLAILTPDAELGQRRAMDEKQRAKDYWNSLDAQQQDALKAELDRVHRWQQTPDSAEALASIPMLKLEDIQGEPQKLPYTAAKQGENTVLLHDVGGDLCYIDLHFDASDLSPEEISLLNVTANLLGALATEKYTSTQLQSAIRRNLGDFSVKPAFYHIDSAHHRTMVGVYGVCLNENRIPAAELMAEILNTTRFTDAPAVLKILRQMKAANQQKLVSRGNLYAAYRVKAQQSSAGVAAEHFTGCESIRYVAQNAQKSPDEIALLLPQMEALCRRIFCAERLTVSVSKNGADLVPALLSAFPQGKATPQSAEFALYPKCREGIRIPGSVGYSACGANIAQFGKHFEGSMYALSNMMTYEYLWTEVRVKGGAYGTGFKVTPDDDLRATSYRDPTPGKSMDTFAHCADAVRQLCSEGADLTKFIVGAMSEADPLLEGAEIIRAGESCCFGNVSYEKLAERRRSLLACTKETLLKLCPVLEQAMTYGSSCIIAGAQLLEQSKDKIDTIVEIPC